jgi:tRNA(Glu) U13 pseudouridine synthase TruD
MENKSIIENNEYLSFLGIYIPEKESFPLGYLKLYPEDFIVEEIDERGRVINIEKRDRTDPSLPEESRFFHATLVKCNIRTNEALQEIARQLDCDVKQVQSAGLKDEDAITAQKISFEKIPLSSIKRLSSPHFFIKDIHLGSKRIYNGTHQGNKFTILVRTDADSHSLRKGQESVFFNYYYTQRFAVRYASHLWGIYALRGEYERLLRHYFSFDSVQETPTYRELRKKSVEHYGDWIEMEKVFSEADSYFVNELKVLRSLKDHPEDFIAALKTIEDQVKLWLYAFSSWLFNSKIKAFLEAADSLPSALPLYLSDKAEDWEIYRDLVADFGVYPPDFENVSPFTSISIKSNSVPTTAAAFVHDVVKTSEGVVISFSLGKGSYATTFLSHHFNLVVKKFPDNFNVGHCDIKKSLGEPSLSPVVDTFGGVI